MSAAANVAADGAAKHLGRQNLHGYEKMTWKMECSERHHPIQTRFHSRSWCPSAASVLQSPAIPCRQRGQLIFLLASARVLALSGTNIRHSMGHSLVFSD